MNIVLVGMPGCGKSTVGVLLAKALCMDFVDTDVVLQVREGAPLSAIIAREGLGGFLRREEEAVLALSCDGAVIATGGSVVYGARAMEKLKAGGKVVYLELPLPALEKRLGDLRARGVALRDGQTLSDLYAERVPLYEAAADALVPTLGLTAAETVETVIARLRGMGLPL